MSTRKRVYVESPFASKLPGGVEKNVKYLHQCMRECVLRGEAPFASHAMYTLFLDDKVPEERAAGIECGFAWADIGADESILYVDRGLSPGMKRGFDVALAAGRGISFRRLGIDNRVMWVPMPDVPSIAEDMWRFAVDTYGAAQ